MRYILVTVFLTMNMNFGIVSDASAACCGATVGRTFQNASSQSNEDSRNAGFIFTIFIAGLCTWANAKKNK